MTEQGNQDAPPTYAIYVPLPVNKEGMKRALGDMRRLYVADGDDGSQRILAAAGIAVRHNLTDAEAVETIQGLLLQSPAPRSYSDADILGLVRMAEATAKRGELSQPTTATSGKAGTPTLPIPRAEPFRPFPVDALPDRVRVFVEEISAATGTDPACAALAVMVVVAGCIGNRVAARMKKTWIEPSVLWGALVGKSGTIKTAVLKLATGAIIDVFKAERRAYLDAKKKHQCEVERHAVRLSEWRKSQKDGPETAPPDEPKPPAERRLLVSDITIEKLGELLEQNPLGLLLVRDELAAWVGAFDRYAAGGKGSDQPAWLSMHDAAPVTIDRKSGKGNYFVERAAVSVLGSIQPGSLSRIFGAAEREAGLLARLLVVYPPDRPTLWRSEADLSDDLAEEWRSLIGNLLALPTDLDKCGIPQPRLIRMEKEAEAIWGPWHDRHERQRVNLTDDDFASYFAKLKGRCARIALLFTCVDAVTTGNPIQHITVDAMRRAITVVEWLKNEGQRVYAILNEDEKAQAHRQLIEWIERRGGSVTARELTHHLQQFRGQTDKAKQALDMLAKAGIGTWSHPAPGPQGGRPSERFTLASPDSDPTASPPPPPPPVEPLATQPGTPNTNTPAGGTATGGFGSGATKGEPTKIPAPPPPPVVEPPSPPM